MFLSTLLINVGENPDRPRPGRLWLHNLYHVHQRLCMAFPSDSRRTDDPQFLAPYRPDDFPEQRSLADRSAQEVGVDMLKQVHAPRGAEHGFLFRIDPQPHGGVVILVQSAIKPNWNYAFHNAEFLLAAPPEKNPFDPSFTKGQRLRFHLLANPTRKIDTLSKEERKAKAKGRHGKRVPVPIEKLHDWPADWIQRRKIPPGFFIEQVDIIQAGYLYVNKNREGKGQRLRSVRYEGMLKVTDPALFRETLVNGIGPAKAFGFGLLSVRPVRE